MKKSLFFWIAYPIFFLILFAAPTIRGAILASTDSAAPAAPNIVLIMVDDLDFGLAKQLYQGDHLPNIETFLSSPGTLFLNTYVTVSLCCPSRATLLSGQYSHNHGVLGNDPPNGGVSQFDDSSTVATWLHDGGYLVGHVGKYLNGYGTNDLAPPTDPFNPLYVPPGYDYWRTLTSSVLRFYDYEINHDGTLVRYGTTEQAYQTDVLANLAADFVVQAESTDAQPFFLIVTPVAPHVERGPDAPVVPGCSNPEFSASLRSAPRHAGILSALPLPRPATFNESNMTDKPIFMQTHLPVMTTGDEICAETVHRARAESMLAVDDLVGTIVSALVANDEWDNTVVIFTSDNGYYMGQHRLTQKLFSYEEGIRVPLVIRAPGYPPGQIVTQLALNNDLAPTIADFAGVTPGHQVDGRSLLPLMQDPLHTPWRTAFLVEYLGVVSRYPTFPHFTAIRTAQTDPTTPNQHYVMWQDPRQSREYYELTADPFQIQSRHDDPQTAPQRQLLEQRLQQLETCGNGTCQLIEDS